MSFVNSRARGTKPHTRETVWVEGLLAGVLHQSITARRLQNGGASGGGSTVGSVTAGVLARSVPGGGARPPGFNSNAWRGSAGGGVSDIDGGVEGQRRSRHASVDNLVMDLNHRARGTGRTTIQQ